MRVNAVLFWVIGAFFLICTIAYTVWNIISHGGVEWAGSIAMGLCFVLGSFLAFYLGRVRNSQGGELPEDRLDANIDDGDAELGFFSPWSWWPLVLAFSIGLALLGLAVGFWLTFCAVGLVLISLVGWVFEYYRGNFAR